MEFVLKLTEGDREVLIDEIKKAIRSEMDEIISQLGKTKEDNEYITLEEALKILKCSKATLFNYRKKGMINYYQVGRKIFFRKDEIMHNVRVDRKRRGRFS